MVRPIPSYLSSKPAVYAKEVLQRYGFKVPPICEKEVTASLNLRLHPITTDILKEYKREKNDILIIDRLSKVLEKSCAWLQKFPGVPSHIWFSDSMPDPRKRLSIFHECGHAIIPWHQEINYLCNQDDIMNHSNKRIEQEAFDCGMEFLMPRQMFYDDINDLDINFGSIKILKQRYNSSFEATAIRFASINPLKCAFVVIEPHYNHEKEKPYSPDQNNAQLHFSPDILANYVSREIRPFPLRIKYSKCSKSFPQQFIKSGSPIYEDNPIFMCWNNKEQSQVEIPAFALGSSKRNIYQTEYIHYHKPEKLFLLLYVQDNQTSFIKN